MNSILENEFLRKVAKLPLIRKLKPVYLRHLAKKIIAEDLAAMSMNKAEAISLKDRQIIDKILPGVTTIADVGCEGAKITAYLSLVGYEMTGIDLDSSMIKYVQGLLRKNNYNFNINFIVGDIYKLPFSDNYFDCVISSEAIEHLKNPKRGIDELVRIAKKQVIITTPVLYSFNHFDHKQHFDDQDIEELFKDYDFEYRKIITKKKDIESGQKAFLITIAKEQRRNAKHLSAGFWDY
jgi:ubiquinone/menaquinone biosynthesis C-methylase UbiE